MSENDNKEFLEAAARAEGMAVQMLMSLALAEYRLRNKIGHAKFELGAVVRTPAVEAVPQDRQIDCLARHSAGEWGLMPQYDRDINDRMLVEQGRVMSAWAIDPKSHANGSTLNTFWIITDAPGVVTTILMPDDY